MLSFTDRKEGTVKHNEELPETGKDEMNLVEFPITLLAKRHDPQIKTLEFSDMVEGEGGKLVKREWVVTGSDKYGLPLAQDNDILLALMAIGKEKNFSSRRIYFSRYRLCEIMGWKLGGSGYKRIEEGIDRFTGVKIKAKNGFYDNIRKCYVTKHFGIIDSYELLDSSVPGPPGQDTFPFSYVNLSEELFESIQAGYIKSLDIKIYYRFESAVTKRLYRYLDKKAYNKKKFEIGLFTLAEVHLGLQKTKYASHIKEKLNPAHEELIKAGFLESADYQKTVDGSSQKVVYHFTQRAQSTGEALCGTVHETEAPVFPPLDSALLAQLVTIGVTRNMAEQLLREYPLEAVRAQVEALPHRKAEDAPAVLVSSIMNDWTPPGSYRKDTQGQARAEAEKKRMEQEKRQKTEHRARIEGYLSSLSSKEREELICQARDQARQEYEALFPGREVPGYQVTGYLHILVEKRLESPGPCASSLRRG